MGIRLLVIVSECGWGRVGAMVLDAVAHGARPACLCPPLGTGRLQGFPGALVGSVPGYAAYPQRLGRVLPC